MIQLVFRASLTIECMVEEVLYLIHKPHGCGCGAADAYMVFAGEPTEVDFALVAYKITQWIHLVALLEEYATVAALASAHKEYNIVILSKLTNLRNAICHSAAYSVVALELHFMVIDAVFYLTHHFLKALERFGGL